ncbi:MAG TPA: UDP binding domain-containing protein, partial [Candidatus Dormibacteraeota bacterium]|nr:UDP binding domain-containing protein [Candidatus Dormibacteraeota bacterium]
WKAREYGKHTRFIELAGEINTAMPEYVVQRATEALNAQFKSVRGSRVLILGLAYKPNVDDDRESPSYTLLDLFKGLGAKLGYYDPHVPVIRMTREHGHWAGTRSISWDAQSVGAFDVVVIATAHKDVNYQQLVDWSRCIVDTRNATKGLAVQPDQVWKA